MLKTCLKKCWKKKKTDKLKKLNKRSTSFFFFDVKTLN